MNQECEDEGHRFFGYGMTSILFGLLNFGKVIMCERCGSVVRFSKSNGTTLAVIIPPVVKSTGVGV